MRCYLLYTALGFGLAALSCHGRPASVLGEGTSFHVGAGYPRSFQLPDGSTVVMNPGTSLSLAKGFGKDNRDLDLDGEAVVEVSRTEARPFVIHTRDLVIALLDAGNGARFHVDAYRSKAGEEVDLLEGRLRVKKSYHSDTDNEPETLNAGEMVMINHDIDLMEKEKLSPAELDKLKAKQ
jgi:transmembrane sensor